MNSSVVLTVAGIVLTIVLGAWSIYLALKRRYPGRITFVEESAIGLFDSIVRNLPELSVLFKGKAVSENLVLLKGFFVNSGTKDITEEMVTEKLEIELPDGYKWLAARVVSASPSLQADASIENECHLSFALGLFRCNEYIRFECLAEVPAGEHASYSQFRVASKLSDVLKFSHRIADTQKVTRAALGDDDEPVNFWPVTWAIGCSLIIGLLLFFIYGPHSRENADLRFFLSTNLESIEVGLRPLEGGTVEIIGISSKYDEFVPAADLFRRNLEARVVPRKQRHFDRVIVRPMLVLLILIAGAASVFTYLTNRRDKRLRRILREQA